MSNQHTHRADNNGPVCSEEPDSKIPDSQIDVCHHSRLRFLERVDGSCPNPSQQLRKIFRTGVPADDHPAVDSGRAMQSGDVIVVYRGSVATPRIVTVLIDHGDSR